MVRVEQEIAFVDSLTMLFNNKVISRAELRAALSNLSCYKDVCKGSDVSKKSPKKRS